MKLPFSASEPDVLPVLRLFLIVEWIYLTIELLFPTRMPPAPRPDVMWELEWLETTLLLGYFAWPRVWQRLGRAYVPLAVWSLALGPVLWQAVGTAAQIQHGVHGDAALVDPNRLYLVLLLPLLLISVQYRVRTLLLFTIGTPLLSIILIAPLARESGFALAPMITNAVDRLVIFTFAGVIAVQLSNAQRRLRQVLIERQAELARYALVVEQLAVSRERNRIARDLHDTLMHSLSAISVQLSAIDVQWDAHPTQARAMVRQTGEMTRAGLDDARRALHALRASPVEALGLVLALRQAAEQAAARGPFALDFAASADPAELAPEAAQQIYRIADEALTNIVRHADARHVHMTLTCINRAWQMAIADDGQGFDATATPAGHYGLTGMHERAALIGASISVTSTPGAGTTISVHVPTTQEATNAAHRHRR